MTRTSNARLAGFMFLFYIVTVLPSGILYDRATSGATTAAKLASIAQHTTAMRVTAVLDLIGILDAIILAVALYALTRDEDRDLAVLALLCRVGEGLTGTISTMATLGLLALANGAIGDKASADAIATILLTLPVWIFNVAATLFAIGSTLYAWLFVRARSIPAWLAWLGFVGSIVLVIGLPLEMVHVIQRPLSGLMWVPVALYELILGVWLLVKGVSPAHEPQLEVEAIDVAAPASSTA